MEPYIGKKDAERIRIVESSEAGRRMLEKTAKTTSTKMLYSRGALLLKEYLSKGLDEIVNEYKQDLQANMYAGFEKWEMIMEDFGTWLEKKGKGTTPTVYFQGAKNLINANVPKSMELKVKSPRGRSRTIPPITIEDLRKIRKLADEREGAFIDLLKDSGISRSDAVRMNYKDVKKAVENPNIHYLPIRMYRAKEGVEYTTWIGENAIESLRLYFGIRKRKGEIITDETPIFASNMKPYERLNPRTLSQVLKRLQHRTGIKITTHRLRKFFETYITAGGVHPVTAKVWMGHKVGADVESRYIIPPLNLQREQYEKSYSYIDLRETREVEALWEAEVKARLEAMPPVVRQRFIEELRTRYGLKRVERLVKAPEIEELLKATKADGGLPANIYCEQYKQINENVLLDYLRNGWQVVHKLQSGEVIVKR